LARGQGEPEQGRIGFGLGLLTDLEPPGAWEARPLSEPILRLLPASPQAIAESWSGFEAVGWQGTIDGAPFVAELGRAGDHRFVHGGRPDADGGMGAETRAVHHLSADARVLRCAPRNPSEPSWWRLVLDSVLFTTALIEGYEALHAAAVATPEGGVTAITAAMGGGKSTLLWELLRRGLRLMADDVLVLEPASAGGPPLTHPAPPLMTVPAARLPALSRSDLAAWRDLDAAADAAASSTPAGPPEPICTLEGECWVAVPTHPRPLPLRSLVVLDRRPGAQLALTKIDDPLVPLMGSLMHFPLTPRRERARFELASAIAARTALWRLTADLDTPPEMLADALLAGVLDEGFRSVGAATHVCAEPSRC
jgi:hypothetical protein